jgi:hypothetical protein
MSNTEREPAEVLCDETGGGPGVTVLVPRDVPLGGPRAMNVRRIDIEPQRRTGVEAELGTQHRDREVDW